MRRGPCWRCCATLRRGGASRFWGRCSNSAAGPSRLHRDVGNYAAVCGIDVLVGIRGAACYMVDAAKRAGLTGRRRVFFRRSRRSGTAGAHAGAAGRCHPVQGLARRTCGTRAGTSFSPPKQGQELTHVLLAILRKTVPSIIRPSGCFNTRLFARRMASLTAMLLSIAAGSLADRTLARISDRPAHSGRRSAIASQESRARRPWAAC